MSEINQIHVEPIEEIYRYLELKFNELSSHDDKSLINKYMLGRKTEKQLFSDIKGCCYYCYRILEDVVKRYKIAEEPNLKFIDYDVKKICLELFRPYLIDNTELIRLKKKLEHKATVFKVEHGIIDEDPPIDMYNSMVVYLEDFVMGLSA